MALVSCPECGQRVSDGARTCPNCGLDSPGGVAHLEIQRVRRLSGGGIPMSVLVDSGYTGDLIFGQGLSVAVSPGRHQIECRVQSPAAPSGVLQLDLPAGCHVIVSVTTSMLGFRPSFSATLV